MRFIGCESDNYPDGFLVNSDQIICIYIEKYRESYRVVAQLRELAVTVISKNTTLEQCKTSLERLKGPDL